jgi:hypothetical protein
MFNLENRDRADWSLLQNGPVNLFWRMAGFEAAITSLAQLNYHIIRLRFTDPTQFQLDVSTALKWREQFSYEPWTGDLNALEDGFSGEPFNTANDSAVCIGNFDVLHASDRQLSFHLLDIIERQSRNYLLFSKRLIGLIQTNDVNYRCAGIGSTGAHWNQAEWLDSSRGL